jgi:hypothetical protein
METASICKLSAAIVMVSSFYACAEENKSSEPRTADTGTDTSTATDTGSATETGELCSWNVHVSLDDENRGPLNDVWGFSPEDVFVVGEVKQAIDSSYSVGFVKRWNGNSFDNSYYCEHPSRMKAVWGRSPTDVYAAGSLHEIESGSGRGFVVHFDGEEWSFSCENEGLWPSALWGDPGLSGVYIAGGNAESNAAVYFHSDSATALLLEVPNLSTFVDIWGQSTDDVYVLGTTNIQEHSGSSHVYHYDGETWNEIPSSFPQRLFALGGNATDSLYAVGAHWSANYGNPPYSIHHYDGELWSTAETNDEFKPNDVLALAPERVLVAGVLDSSSPSHMSMMLFDGESWETDPFEMPGIDDLGMECFFNAMSAVSPGDIFFVGGNWYNSVIFQLSCNWE